MDKILLTVSLKYEVLVKLQPVNFFRVEGTSSSLRESPLFVPELKKQDSFEGHEAAVRSLVEAVHESRKLEAKQRKKSEG